MDPDKVKAALEALKNGDGAAALVILEEIVASAAGAPAEGASEADPLASGADPAMAAANTAALAALCKLTGKTGPGEAIVALTALQAQVEKLAAESAAVELTQRRELVGELVKLGVEFPSTAWDGEPKDRKPVERLAKEPIEGLRARVVQLRALRPTTGVKPPVESDLSESEMKLTAKMTPEQKARFVALRATRRAS